MPAPMMTRSAPTGDGPARTGARSGTTTEPRWPAVLAALAVGSLYLALPPTLTIGPPWLLLVIVTVVLVPVHAAHAAGRHELNQQLGYVLLGVVTAALVWGLMRLVASLPSRLEPAPDLLRSAVALWTANVLVFASWYWRLDAGGPHQRDRHRAASAVHGEPAHSVTHEGTAFLFPQMTMALATPASATSERPDGRPRWSPHFMDYLFLAFTTSTAFSPTDSPVLSRKAKFLVMLQAVISFTTVAVLAARAVNTL